MRSLQIVKYGVQCCLSFMGQIKTESQALLSNLNGVSITFCILLYNIPQNFSIIIFFDGFPAKIPSVMPSEASATFSCRDDHESLSAKVCWPKRRPAHEGALHWLLSQKYLRCIFWGLFQQSHLAHIAFLIVQNYLVLQQ